jgi:hypothetical protein
VNNFTPFGFKNINRSLVIGELALFYHKSNFLILAGNVLRKSPFGRFWQIYIPFLYLGVRGIPAKKCTIRIAEPFLFSNELHDLSWLRRGAPGLSAAGQADDALALGRS